MKPRGSRIHWIGALLRNLLRGRARDADLRANVGAFVDLLTQEKIAAGMTPEAARRAAMLECGSVDAVIEDVRDVRAGALVAQVWQDTRFALRILRREPTFSAVAILTLALGIGANTAIFSVVNAVLLEPLPYAHPERLVLLWERNTAIGKDRDLVAPPNFHDWRRGNTVFDELGAYRFREFALTHVEQPEQLQALSTTASLFRVLGVAPALGRAFTDDEEQRRERVAVLSHAFWQQRFGGDPSVVGRSIALDEAAFTILGVMPSNSAPRSSRRRGAVPLASTPSCGIQAVRRSRSGRRPDMAEPRYPFTSRHVDVLGHRIHYVEHGSGSPVLFLHGNPTSSYVWRNVLPYVATQIGRRGIAPDLLGFGRSDKPDDVPYSLDLHARIVQGFIDTLDLHDIVLVAEDWGGPLGMHDVVARPERYESAILTETFLWTFTFEDDFEPKFRMPFRLMRGPLGFVCVQMLNMMTKKLIPEHCPITDEGMRYYLESMPTVRSRRAMLEFVRLNPLLGKPETSVDFMDRIRNGLRRLTVPVTWLKATPGVVPSDDYPRSLKKLDELRQMVPRFQIKEFGPGHHFLAEENPARVVELVTEIIRGHALAAAGGRVLA